MTNSEFNSLNITFPPANPSTHTTGSTESSVRCAEPVVLECNMRGKSTACETLSGVPMHVDRLNEPDGHTRSHHR